MVEYENASEMIWDIDIVLISSGLVESGNAFGMRRLCQRLTVIMSRSKHY